MIALRPSAERMRTRIGWLDSRHTFSFGEHHDPRHMGYRSLRVINEDRVAPAQGFPTHPHRDMEIVSYVLEGSLSHQDSMGTGSVIRPGDLQRMSAGTGVRHSEFNTSELEPVHFLQIWILPERSGIEPSYEQRAFPLADRVGRLTLLASRDGRDGSVVVHQDVALWSAALAPQGGVVHPVKAGRHVWTQVARGAVTLNGVALVAGDGAAIDEEAAVEIVAAADSEVLLFDLA